MTRPELETFIRLLWLTNDFGFLRPNLHGSQWGSSLTNVTRTFIFLFICILLFSLWRYLHAAQNLTCHRLMLVEPTVKVNVNSGHIVPNCACTNPSSVKLHKIPQLLQASTINGTLLARDLRASQRPVTERVECSMCYSSTARREDRVLVSGNQIECGKERRLGIIFVDLHNCQIPESSLAFRNFFRIHRHITVTVREAWNTNIRCWLVTRKESNQNQ